MLIAPEVYFYVALLKIIAVSPLVNAASTIPVLCNFRYRFDFFTCKHFLNAQCFLKLNTVEFSSVIYNPMNYILNGYFIGMIKDDRDRGLL